MPATATDRLYGLTTSVAVKPPCLVATTANITLSGLQTVDGVALAGDNRVLVKNQTDTTTNGIYEANTSRWSRAPDFDGARDAVDGSLIVVRSGQTNSNTIWEVTTANPVVIGTSALTFQKAVLSDSATAAFIQAGAGAVAEDAQTKMREIVSVRDFMTTAQKTASTAYSYTLDTTASLDAAQTAGDHIWLPGGGYLLTNFRPKSGKVFRGAGYEKSIIKQGAAGSYAFNALADGSSGIGFLIGTELHDVGFIGATSATVSVVNVEAQGAYAITHCKFDFVARNTYSPMRIICPTAGAVYNCDFRVISDVSQTGIISQGTYNRLDFFVTGAADSLPVFDTSTACFFSRIVTDGTVRLSGPHNNIALLTCEAYPGPVHALNTVFRIDGINNHIEKMNIITVPAAKAASGFDIYAEQTSIGSLFIVGTATIATPTYPGFLNASSSGRIGNAQSSCPNKLDSYTLGSTLRQWTFEGDCADLLSAPTTRGALNTNYVNYATAGATLYFGIDATRNGWFDSMVIDQAGVLATLTVTLPPLPVNNQVARFSAPRGGVTALTLTPGAGHSVVGAPAGLTGGTSFSLVFVTAQSKWFLQ